MGIRKPAADRNGMLRMEDVRGWRIVDDDGLLEIAANLGEVLFRLERGIDTALDQTCLDVVALVVVAALSEEAVMDGTVNVQLIEKRVAVLEDLSS